MSKIDFNLLSNYLSARDIDGVKKIVTRDNILDTDIDGNDIIAHILWNFDDDFNDDFKSVMLIHYFLDLGASLQTYDDEDWSLLHVAVFNGKTKSIRKLIDSGISVDTYDNANQTPLTFCFNWYKHDDSKPCAQVLLDAGAQLSCVPSDVIPQWAHDFVDYRNTLRGVNVIVLGLKRCNSNVVDISKNGVDVLRIIARCVWELRGIKL